MDNHFSVRKMVQDEQFLSSLESGLRFLTDKHFSSSKNGQDRTVIFVMKMVQWIADVPQTTIPLVVNIGNGLGQSLFLTVTLNSGQEDWSTSPDSHSFEAHSCEHFRRMVCFGGWCRTVISLGNGLDSHSLGQIHSLQVALCLVPEEWPR
jgi:hypothetical protein